MGIAWAYSDEYGQVCQVIETQTLWGETTCCVWLPGCDSVVRIPASRLKSLDSAGPGRQLPSEPPLAVRSEFPQEQLDRKAHAYPEMVPLLVIRVEGGSHE